MISRRPRRNWAQRGVLVLNLGLISASLVAAAALQFGYSQASDIQRVELERSLTPLPEDVAEGERVLNILLVGSDSSVGLDPSDPVQIGRQGERFGDVIILAHIDERSQQMALVSFPRDLWVSLPDTNRNDRINRAFEIGGPAMLIDTIEANFGVPIHHYVNVDFAGFQGLVEAVGSVNVYFETPARDWNVNAKPEPRSQTGFEVTEAGCHALDPPTALAYVRSRFYQTQNEQGVWETDPTSDFGRIARQQDFLRRLMQRAIDLGARNPFVLADLIDTGLENVSIDDELTPQLLLDLGATFQSFDPDQLQTYSFPAVDSVVDGNQVLEPLAGDAEPLLALLRGAPFDDPSTVALSIISPVDAGPDLTSAVSTLAEELEASGFAVERHLLSDVPPGTLVRHGPSGAGAASLVVTAVDQLALDPELVGPASAFAVEHLGGRTIHLTVGGQDLDVEPSTTLGNIASSADGGPRVPSTSTLGEESPITTGSQSEGQQSGDTACR